MYRYGLKRILSVALAIVITASSPIACFAGQTDAAKTVSQSSSQISESVSDSEDVSGKSDENVAGASDEKIDEATNEDANAESDEEVDSKAATSVLFDLDEEEYKRKVDLAASLDRFDSMTEGIDYEAGVVFRSVDSEEKALMIAEIYGIELVSYEYMLAHYNVTGSTSVADIIHLGATLDNNYPAVSPNYYIDNYADFDISEVQPVIDDEVSESAYDEETIDTSDGDSIESYITDIAGLDEPYLNEASVDYQWHHSDIGSLYTLANGIKGQNVKIALCSTGIANSRADIDYTKIENSYSTVQGDASTVDTLGFGTFLAGLLIAKQDSACGVGICPESKLINIRMDNTNVESVCNAIYRSVYYNADIAVIHCAHDLPSNELEYACTYAYNSGVALFAPTAPTGEAYESWPAAYSNVIGVAGLEKTNIRFGECSNSKGADIAAPGVYISSVTHTGSFPYSTYNGNAPACAIAAGEAAVILGEREKLAGFYDRNKTLIPKNSARVDALKKIMQTGATNTGAGTGKGLCYLPKVLGISSAVTVPDKPAINFSPIQLSGSGDTYLLPVAFEPRETDVYTILYTYDGKVPTYRNGVKDKYSYTGFMTYIDLADVKTDVITVNAIAINKFDLVSKVSTVKYNLAGIVKDIKISAPCTKVIPGKSVKMDYSVIPANPKSKQFIWHVSYGGSEANAKSNGVTVTATGTVNVGRNTPAGTIQVWAESKVNPGVVSNKVNITVVSQKLKTIKANRRNHTVYLGYGYEVISKNNLFMMFDCATVSGSPAYVSDVYFTSSNAAVATVDSSNELTVRSAGTFTLTAWASDGSQVKGTIPVTVVQNAVDIYSYSDGYDKVAAGKTLVLKTPYISPINAKVKKITKWEIDAAGKAAGITVSNGRITTKKTTPTGYYTVTAKLENPDKSTISKNLTFQVISDCTSKITLDKKTCQVFRVSNNFSAPTTCTIKAEITGG